LPVEVQEQFERLTKGRLVEGYGVTEASPVTHANPLLGRRKVGSIGIPIPSTEAKIIDLATVNLSRRVNRRASVRAASDAWLLEPTRSHAIKSSPRRLVAHRRRGPHG